MSEPTTAAGRALAIDLVFPRRSAIVPLPPSTCCGRVDHKP